ncbi:MAG: rhodanese-like domain-containing protein [Gammaproteobacteria bacterium]
MHEYLDFAGRHWPLFVALVFVLGLIAFEEIRRRRHGAHELAPTAAVQMLNRGAAVLDCRDAKAYGAGHIVGAQNFPLTEFDAKLATFKRKHDKPVLAIGTTPAEAARAAAKLRRAGFEAVYVLKGGLAAWRKDNLPLEQAQQKGKN